MAATYTIYVPAPDSALCATIKPGSALIGAWRQDHEGQDVLQLDYEGNLYGAEGLARFAQRCMHAAGRLAENYPTSARMFLTPDQVNRELIEVGIYDDGERLVFLDGDDQRALLGEWLGHEELPAEELHAR